MFRTISAVGALIATIFVILLFSYIIVEVADGLNNATQSTHQSGDYTSPHKLLVEVISILRIPADIFKGLCKLAGLPII